MIRTATGSIVVKVDVESPLEFLGRAEALYQAVEVLAERSKFNTSDAITEHTLVLYFILARGVEMALKSYVLLNNGEKPVADAVAELKCSGHDLVRLVERADEAGIVNCDVLTDEDRGIIGALRDCNSAGYPVKGRLHWHNRAAVAHGIRILRKVIEACRRESQQLGQMPGG